MSYALVLLLKFKYAVLFPLGVVEGPVISLVVGFLINKGIFSFWIAFPILLLGDIIPDTIFYLLGFYGQKTKFVQRLISRKDFLANHLLVIERLWLDHPRKIMFFGKLTYGMAILFLTSAGMVKLSFKKFISNAILVSVTQYGVIVLVGYLLGNSYEIASGYIKYFYYLFGIFAVVGIVGYYFVAKYAREKIILLIEEEEQKENKSL